MINLPNVNSGSELYFRSATSRKSGGAERWAGVTEIDWSAEQLFRRSRSAHMLWIDCGHARSRQNR